MKRILLILLLIGGTLFFLQYEQSSESTQSTQDELFVAIEVAYSQQSNDVQVKGEGRVVRLLADDIEGRRHQKFIVELASGHTVLIAHNIDLAPRVESLQVGDVVRFSGEYEWNPQGGVVHWTHHDPAGRHLGGWVELDGKKYE